MDKAEAAATLARLQRAERAHACNQDALRQAAGHFEAEITRLTALTEDIDTAIARRRDTRGEKLANSATPTFKSTLIVQRMPR